MPYHIYCCSLHPFNCSSSCVAFELYSIVCVLALLFCFQFSRFDRCALGNMAKFHAIGYLDLTIMANDSRMTFVSKHYLCITFAF